MSGEGAGQPTGSLQAVQCVEKLLSKNTCALREK